MSEKKKIGLVFVSASIVLAVHAVKAFDRPRNLRGSQPVFALKTSPREAEAAEQAEWDARQADVRYRGISVRAHPHARGATLALHRQVADLMTRLDFVPAARVEHFRWISNSPVVLTGWDGRIAETTPVQGGYLVRVDVFPRHTNGMAVVNDHVTEHYYYSGGRLQFLRATEDPTPKVTTFN